MELAYETQNIKQYLTPKSEIYYNKVISIIEYLKTIAFFDNNSQINNYKVEINIFGGFIRDIISHYFYPDEDFIPSADVDMWFTYYCNDKILSYSQNMWNSLFIKIINDLKMKYNVSKAITTYESVPRETYGVCKATIDNIQFDFNTDINGSSSYKTISDFTVNNLSIDMNGNILKRVNECCDFNVDDIIIHIKQKKLINIVNPKIIEKYIEQGLSTKEIQELLINRREQKMKKYGYKY